MTITNVVPGDAASNYNVVISGAEVFARKPFLQMQLLLLTRYPMRTHHRLARWFVRVIILLQLHSTVLYHQQHSTGQEIILL